MLLDAIIMALKFITLNQAHKLETYLEDGRINIDNNRVYYLINTIFNTIPN